ncbi:hypothetical protein J6590_000304 [Homalodisca vitripennis]|nr:hypothetical protein J6590_000304 [Homalodisca vitripennis]
MTLKYPSDLRGCNIVTGPTTLQGTGTSSLRHDRARSEREAVRARVQWYRKRGGGTCPSQVAGSQEAELSPDGK